MIISRAPFRLSLGGGGTDLPSYYSRYGGFFVSGALNKYVHIAVNKRFEEDSLRLSYSTTEIVRNSDEVRHPLVREALKLTGIRQGIEIVSIADAPSATGLGSSGSFCVGLLRALYSYLRREKTAKEVAEEACNIAMNELREPSGKQDEYVASFGGIHAYEIAKDGEVKVQQLNLSTHTLAELEANTLMFFTGITRQASQVLSKQEAAIREDDGAVRRMHEIKEIGYAVRDALTNGDLAKFGEMLHRHWLAKRGVVNTMSSDQIDEWYGLARENGALGGKLCLAPDTMVAIKDGWKKISDVNVGDEVYDHKNVTRRVTEVVRRRYDGKILEFKVRGLENKIRSTPEHPVFTTAKHPGNKRVGRKIVDLPIFREAKDFQKGDVFLIPVDDTVEDVESIEIPRAVKQSPFSRYDIYDGIPERLTVDFDLLNLLGWYVAEGSRGPKQLFFALNSDEAHIGDQIASTISGRFAHKAVLVFPPETPNGMYVRCSSVALATFFAGLCGSDARSKHLPEFVMRLPLIKQFTVLKALWHGDGCEREAFDKRYSHSTVRFEFKSSSFKLAKQVQQLCLRLGFICGFRREDIPPKRIMKNRRLTPATTPYIVSLNGDDARAFQESIQRGYPVPVQRRNSKGLSLRKDFATIDGIRYSKRSITGISERNYEGEVYNLVVDESHTFISEDIAVHNCGAGGGGFLMLYCDNNREKLRRAMTREGLVEHRFRFDFEGSKIIYNV